MKRPILFNTEMVRAILDGRKTQTRRIAFKHDEIHPFKCANYPDGWWMNGRVYKDFKSMYCDVRRIAPFKVDDILWVRETWAEMPYGFVYRADNEYPEGWDVDDHWHPSIHMPRKAARIFLKVKDVRIEQLHLMDEEDAIAEGFPDSPACTDSPLERFSVLWDKTIKRDALREYGWHANPWVWVIEFERMEGYV